MSNSNHVSEKNINDEYQIRLAKVNFLRNKGIEPWPIEIPVITHSSDQIKFLQEKVVDESFVEKVTIAGRILTKRAHGKAAFFNLQDHRLRRPARRPTPAEQSGPVRHRRSSGDPTAPQETSRPVPMPLGAQFEAERRGVHVGGNPESAVADGLVDAPPRTT